MPEVVRYNNEQEVEADIQLFTKTNDVIVDGSINEMITKIRAIYNKYNITTDTPFSELQRLLPEREAKRVNDELYSLSQKIEDSDFKRELYPMANMTIYDSVGAEIALGLGSLFYTMTKRINKQTQEGGKLELKRLQKAYKIDNSDYHITLRHKFEPYLANDYIKEIYNYRSQFRSDLMAQRTIEHTVDKLQKRALVIKGRNKSNLITEMTHTQLQEQLYTIAKSGFPRYEIGTETNACHICLPFRGKTFPVEEYKEGINAPHWHLNCRCWIFGSN